MEVEEVEERTEQREEDEEEGERWRVGRVRRMAGIAMRCENVVDDVEEDREVDVGVDDDEDERRGTSRWRSSEDREIERGQGRI